jgi:hypothetical protein
MRQWMGDMMKRFFLLVCVILASSWLPSPAQDKQPVIVFDSPKKDVGKVNEGDPIKHVFRFTNKGQARLDILSVEPG